MIDDPADPRIFDYRAVRERDLVGRQGLFIAEGEVVLRTLARLGRHEISSVLLAESRVPALSDLIDSLPAHTPVYAASQGVLNAIAGFDIHRGILAVGRRAPPPDPDELLASLPERALVLGLFGIGNHDNMGGIFRNAAAFGVDAVLLDETCCDPLYRKAIRVSVAGALTVPFTRMSGDLLDLLARHGFEAIALSPAGAPLPDLKRPDRAALLLGSEGPGLSRELMARARTVGIPMAGGFDSLNVATTSGIALYQLTLR